MKTTRRAFLTSLAGAGSAASLMPRALVAEEAGPLRIGLIADAQFADADPAGTRFYRHSLGKLREAAESLAGWSPAFVVHLGDFIDRDWSSFDAVFDAAAALDCPLHHVLGNHDFDVADERKRQVPDRLSIPERYRQLRAGGVRFLFLDTNDVSTYALPSDSAAARAAHARMKALKDGGTVQANPWNGALGSGQLEWLDRRLTEADAAGEPAIVFAHHPVLPEEGHCVWNAGEVLAILDRHPRFAAWLNGHNHAGGYAERAGAHFLTLHGMVETESTTAFSRAEISAAGIAVQGFGREPSRHLAFR